MPAVLIVFSSPTSTEVDEAYRTWFTQVHIPELRAAIPELADVSWYRTLGDPSQPARYASVSTAPGLEAASLAAKMGEAQARGALSVGEHMATTGDLAPDVRIGDLVA